MSFGTKADPTVISLISNSDPAQLNCSAERGQSAALAESLKSVTQKLCEQNYAAKKCQDVKDSLAPEDQNKVLNCDQSEHNGASPLTLLVGCGDGAISFAVDTVNGIIQLPSAILETGKWLNQCNGDIAMRRAMLAPIAMTFSPDQAESMAREMRCDGIAATLQSQIPVIWKTIAEKETLQRQFLENSVPPLPSQIQLTPGELDFKKSQLPDYNALDALWAAVANGRNCYTPQAKAEVFCKILIKLGTTAAIALRGPALINMVSKYAPQIVRTAATVSDARALSAAERTAILARNGALNDVERLKEAQRLAGRRFSEPEKNAILQAHEVGAERGAAHGSYTYAEIRKKVEILKDAGFSSKEIGHFMRYGIAGYDLGAQLELTRRLLMDVWDDAPPQARNSNSTSTAANGRNLGATDLEQSAGGSCGRCRRSQATKAKDHRRHHDSWT